MEQPALEKFIMAKLCLPEEVKKEIKRFLPTIATPTARLIKRLRFERDERWPEKTLVYGSTRWRAYLRQRVLKARWAPPPMRPTLIYKEGVRSKECLGSVPFNNHWRTGPYSGNTYGRAHRDTWGLVHTDISRQSGRSAGLGASSPGTDASSNQTLNTKNL